MLYYYISILYNLSKKSKALQTYNFVQQIVKK